MLLGSGCWSTPEPTTFGPPASGRAQQEGAGGREAAAGHHGHPGVAPLALKNPAIISMPLAFAVGIVVSLAAPERTAEAGYAAAVTRMHLGSRDAA